MTSSPTVQIVPLPIDDIDALVEAGTLYDQAFRTHSQLGHFNEREFDFAYELTQKGNFIARSDGRTIGFGIMDRCRGGSVRQLLEVWRHTTLTSHERRYLSTLPADDLEEIQIRRHPRRRGDPLWHLAYPRSYVLTALAVQPQWRRQGVGAALAKARIRFARSLGAQAVFVHCLAGSGSERLYASLGFSPILELAPYYADHRGVFLKGLAL